MDVRDGILEAWVEYLGSDMEPFPRDVSTYYVPDGGHVLGGWYPRRKVEDEDGYLDYLRRDWLRDVVVGVHSDPHIERREISRLKGEVGDNSLLHVAYRQACTLDRGFRRLGIRAAWVFTGGRSFHFHIPFRLCRLKTERYNVPVIVMQELLKNVRAVVGMKREPDIDWKVVGDFRRLLRPPYTLRIKRMFKNRERMFSVPVDFQEHRRLVDVERSSRACSLEVEFVLEEGYNHAVRRMVVDTDKALHRHEQMVGNALSDFTPVKARGSFKGLIEHLMACAPRVRDGRHRILFHLLIPALRCGGYSFEAAMAEVERFILASGASFELYRPAAEYWFLREAEDGEPYRPMRLSRFFEEYPELERMLRR